MEAANRMILEWLDGNFSPSNVESVAQYMSQTLRIGGIKSCRALVCGAIAGVR